jgi:endonuclease/exonuclease/phosphatase family metal-dependent hydrolase
MKLVTWNVQWGLGMDGRVDLARIVAHARALGDFDVLCLQEVAANCRDLPGLGDEDQFAAFARLLPEFDAVAGVALDIPDGRGGRQRFGNMILSRLPVDAIIRQTLPWPGEPGKSMPRMALDVVVTAPFGPVRIMTTHLEYWSATLRSAQIEGLRSLHSDASGRTACPREAGPATYAVGPLTSSAILTGDFNMPPEDAAIARLLQPFETGTPRFLDAWRLANPVSPQPATICREDQTYGPPKACDLVFVTEDLASRVARVAVDVDTRASDHQPVLVELDDRPA